MTVIELHNLLARLIAEGKGSCTVLLSSNLEGNRMLPLDWGHFEGLWNAKKLEAQEQAPGEKPNCIALYPTEQEVKKTKMKDGYLICIGDPFNGMTLYGPGGGLMFDSRDAAIAMAENEFDEWQIVVVGTA
jgi:hypothetical protein